LHSIAWNNNDANVDFRFPGALPRFAIKTWASEQMALPILRKDSVSLSAAFPTRLLLASVRHPGVELIKRLCFEREVID
jgi:hypothetical protein